MSITEYREEYLPKGGFEYPQFFEKYQNFFSSMWRAQEVSFAKDVRDWEESTEGERAVISGILNGFTLLESHVQQYWATVVPRIFPKHEICALAQAYAFSEVIHAEAYNHLSATLGINDHDNFLATPEARKKLDFFINDHSSDKVKLAVFSACGEGVSLWSSFCVLLHFSRDARFTGLRQVLSWSVADETHHSNAAAELFRILVVEQGVSVEELADIRKAMDQVLENEDSFLDRVFERGDLIAKTTFDSELRKDDVKAYLRYRANDRLSELGLNPCYTYNREAFERIAEWFHPMVKGVSENDAFANSKNGDAYIAKPLLDWSTIDLMTTNLKLQKELSI